MNELEYLNKLLDVLDEKLADKFDVSPEEIKPYTDEVFEGMDEYLAKFKKYSVEEIKEILSEIDW